MGTIRERMAVFLDSQGVSDYAFEKQLGLSKGYMNKCKNPSGDVLEKMCGIYPTISAEWLLREEGEMIRDLHDRLEEAASEDHSFELNNIEELVSKIVEKKLNERRKAE